MPPIKPGNYKKYFQMLDRFFAEHHEYQVVHSHINENSSFVLKAAKNAKIPCRIAHSHLSDLAIDYKLPFRIYARYAMKNNPTDLFACSKKAGEWLFGKRHKTHHVHILNNAVNTKEFQFDKEIRTRLRKEIGATPNQLVIGHIGRFNKQKNHSFLIDILKAVKVKDPMSF